MAPSPPLLFALNGTKVELASIDPSMTLLSYLRLHTRFSGTKLSCGEGGCGACLVLLSKYDPKTRKIEEFTINSCLTLLCSIDGCSVTTIEGLGNTQKGFHSVQERIAGFHGSQCGYCTPGMCMSMYACLNNAQSDTLNTVTCKPLHTIPSLSVERAQTAIVGNICRCTGYRPIVDACKSFAGDVDVEELGINAFWASKRDANLELLPVYEKGRSARFPQFLLDALNAQEDMHDCNGQAAPESGLTHPSLNIRYADGGLNSDERLWIKTPTLDSLFEAFQNNQKRDDVKLVVGNTSAGYYKELRPRVFLDISSVPELLILKETACGIEVGSAVTIEKLIRVLEDKSINTGSDSVPRGLVSHLKKVANPHVRNRASVGGNLIMAQQFSFDSDLTTLFLSIDVTLKLLRSDRKVSIVSMEDFLQLNTLDNGMILQSILIPLWSNERISSGGNSNVYVANDHSESHEGNDTRIKFKSYRAAPRPLGNALAFLNAAFLVDISVPIKNGTCEERKISDLKLAFGAFGQSRAIRAKDVEGFLRGKPVNACNLLRAIEMLKVELAGPLKGTKKASYRSSVAVGFLFEFFRPMLPETSMHPSNGALHTPVSSTIVDFAKDSHEQNGAKIIDHTSDSLRHSKTGYCISGKQTIPSYAEDYSLGKPAQKFEAKIQAAGEAVYVDDIPSPDHCLYAAFVLSEKALAKIKHVDLTQALASPGVVAYISAKDIPKGGANIGAIAFSGSENLFAEDIVEYVGHPLGIVVADSPQHAKDGALKVRVAYDVETLGSPVLSIEEAIEKNSYFSVPPFCQRATVGNADTEIAEGDQTVINGEVRTGSQYFFYMETQTALAIPDEDDCIVVHSSCQSPEIVQKRISTCLGLPTHNVRIITRRAGGGFGGKAFRSITVSSACAVAAYKIRQPVRMYLDRATDMIMMGGRHPTKTTYTVACNSSGKITGLKAKVFMDAGWSEDLSPLLPLLLIGGLKKYDWGSLDVEFKVCKTNLSSKSAMRGPGHIQGSFISDTIVQHVAATLGLNVHTVITNNMHTLDSLKLFYGEANSGGSEGYTLHSMWTRMLEQMEARQRDVYNFNCVNVWTKRGLSILPCVYDVEHRSMPARVSIFHDGSVVVEVGGIELGQGLWTKVKQAAIYGLSQLWPAPNAASESMKVRVVQADSISLVNGGLTAASTTSEGSCEAVRQACQVLVDRLMPLKLKKEQESSGIISWLELIKQAQAVDVDLSAQIRWIPENNSKRYLNYGVAATEVELNVLTGEVAIIESDIMYDCGKSLNPAVDIGQIEGSFVQGIGFFMTEEHEVDSNGRLVSDCTWTYKPPTVDNIPRRFCVELMNGPAHENRVLSSKASGEPPLLLAGSVHAAVKRAIEAAKETVGEVSEGLETQKKGRYFRLDAPATMEQIKHLCGLDTVEQYLKHQLSLSEVQ